MDALQYRGEKMDIDRTISVQIQGLLVFESPLHHDERGLFLENWRKKEFACKWGARVILSS